MSWKKNPASELAEAAKVHVQTYVFHIEADGQSDPSSSIELVKLKVLR